MGVMTAARAHRNRLAGVFALTLAVLMIEIIGSYLTDSLALLADAGHLLTDTVGIGLALGAIWFAGRPPSETRTSAVELEYWPTMDPTAVEGSRDQRLDAYRAVRDELMRRIQLRFAADRAGDV